MTPYPSNPSRPYKGLFNVCLGVGLITFGMTLAGVAPAAYLCGICFLICLGVATAHRY
jgi:hypothetical protein